MKTRSTKRENSTKQPGDLEEQPVMESLTNGKEEPLPDQKAMLLSVFALRLAVFADAVNNTILQPNFPFLVQGEHPDAFPSTAPFDLGAAQYFLPMSAMLGTAIASTVIGRLSDRHGRRPWMLACLGVGVLGSMVKYLLRKTFWGFCAANFVNGLFAASLPVAMAYMGDIKTTRAEKDREIGIIVAFSMLGNTGGGIAAILFGSAGLGLFSPLFVACGVSAFASVVAFFYLIEPKKLQHLLSSEDPKQSETEALEAVQSPKHFDWRLVGNVLAGALADNVGSAGLVPLSLSPLAFEHFYTNFLDAGLNPLMSESTFKWLTTCLALCILPGAAIAPKIFERIGAAGGAVVGNVLTGFAIVALLLIATIEPATTTTFGIFVGLLYVAFPLTVLSQLSTGPMLDALAPADRRGFAQGLNVSVMAIASAVSPFLLGFLTDEMGTVGTMWLCVGVSFAAALINAPLMFAKPLRRAVLLPDHSRALLGEDQELVGKALRGDWLPQKQIDEINLERLQKGKPFLAQPCRSYQADRGEQLHFLRQQGQEDLQYRQEYIAMNVEKIDSYEKRFEAIQNFQLARSPLETRQQIKQDLGQWCVDYLEDSGYFLESPNLWKQLFIRAFPPLLGSGEELSPENLERQMINSAQLFHRYHHTNAYPNHQEWSDSRGGDMSSPDVQSYSV